MKRTIHSVWFSVEWFYIRQESLKVDRISKKKAATESIKCWDRYNGFNSSVRIFTIKMSWFNETHLISKNLTISCLHTLKIKKLVEKKKLNSYVKSQNKSRTQRKHDF